MPPRKGGRKRKLADDDSEEQSRARQPKQVKAEIQPAEEAVPPFAEELPAAGGEAENDPAAVQETLAVELQPDEVNEEPDAFAANEQEIAAPAAQPQESAESSSSSSSSSSAAAQEEAQHAPAADEEAVPADAEVDVMEQQVDPPAEPPVSSNAKQVASASKKSSNSSSSSSSSKAANKKKDPPSASSKKNQPLSAGKVVNSASKAVSFKKPAKKDTIETLLPPLEEDEEKPEPKSAMKGNKAKTPMKVQFSQAEVEEFSASQLNGTPRLDPVTGLPLNSSAPTSSQQLPVPGASAAASSSSQHHTAAYYNSGSASAPPASSMFMNNSAASEQDQEEYQQGPPPPSGTGSNEGSVRPSAVPGAAPSAQNNTSSNPSSAASPDLPDNNVVQVEKEPEKKQRLMIEKIELENFKSYGEKRTIGPFHQLFSAVIGPNGSGKSNTIDALQFAFGKRAKEVRQNKLSELIHNSKGKENLKMCRVSVYMMDILDEPDFDADKPYTVVPNTEIVLTREATSKNVSTYYLNGKTSSFTEVTDKLKERGVDLVHNRFLILQGEVEAISLMKPKAVKEGGEDGFLEYLEDIIGSNKYVPAIQQGNRDLELITGTRTDKLRMYQMSEKAREQIKPQYKEALKWIETKKHLLISEAYRKQLERKSCRETVTEVQKCHDDAEKLVQENQKKKDEIVEKHKKLTDEHQDLLKVYRAKMDELKGCQEKMAQFEMDDKQCQQEKLETEQKKKQLDEEIREAQKEQADQAKNAEEQEKKVIPQAEQELKSTERFLEVQEDKLKKFENSLSGESSRLREEKMQWEAKQAPLANKKQELRGKLEMLEFERSQLTKHVQEAHARLDRMNMEHGQAIGQRKKLQEEIDFCSEQIHVKTPLVREGQKRLDELAEIIKSKTPILSHLNRQYEEAKYQVEAHRNTSKLMKGLYEARRKGDVDFIDRLGNLGKIDDKYDVAITQAGGGKHAFDQIVTETASQGTAIIKWLSENNAGRARVIALDQVSKEGWDRNPGNLPRPRIFDMVRATEDRLRPAFYLLLKNTLVVETMDEATQVSRHNGRHRVVTLDGGIVDPSGTVTGGGMQKAEGGGLSGPEASGPAYSEAEVEKMKKERDEAREYVAGVEKELVELTPVVQEVSNELEQKTRTKKHYEARVPDLDRNIEHYANRIEEAKTMPVLNPEQEKAVSKLQTEVSKVTSEIGNVDLELTEATDKVSELTNAIFNVGGEELKNLQNEVNNVKKKVEQLRKGHIKAKGQVEIFRKNVQEAVKKEAESRKKQENAEQALVDLEKLVEKTEKEAGECLERFHLLMTETQADEHQRKDLDAQLAKIDEDQNAVAMVLLDVQEQLSRTKEKLQAATASLEDTNRKLELFRKEYKDLPDEDEEEDEEEEDLDEDGIYSAKFYSQGWIRSNKEEQERIDREREAEKEAKRKAKEDAKRKKQWEIKHGPIFDDFQDVWLSVHPDDDEALPEGADVPETGHPRLSLEEVTRSILGIQSKMKTLNQPNFQIFAEYKTRTEELQARKAEFRLADKERTEIRSKLEQEKLKRKQDFLTGFNVISLKLKEMYQMITLGGDAELELVDTYDPFQEGVMFSVRPKLKSWKQITNLSGGEKTLASLALVFALHHYRPTPIYFMDEIDAALDFRNVSIIANYIKQNTKNAQFIIISLRNHMFELADQLVGVCKKNDQSMSVSVNPEKFIAGKKKRGALGYEEDKKVQHLIKRFRDIKKDLKGRGKEHILPAVSRHASPRGSKKPTKTNPTAEDAGESNANEE